ncbi:MAG TPA: alpha-L-fucosidase [Terriglobales bacterium]|nr:alpha-L-fucosidase [Terriglobales bacterium]
MHRRQFCQWLGATAAAAAATRAGASGLGPSPAQAAAAPALDAANFGRVVQDYAAFCAQAPQDRIFYALRGGQIVAERLDESKWQPTGWGDPPPLPVPGGSLDGVPMVSPLAGLSGTGPFQPTWDSLLQYECPDWYRDAKFGIWNHWSPQCVPEDGDWYARNMYLEKSGQAAFHRQHYGPPTRFGYKDLCAQWTLLNWDPEGLMDRYQRAGARFFLALANHHDGFDTWQSRFHPWNATRIGPHRDVIGIWAAAARRRGLRFGVTVHQGRNWWWFQPAHGADAAGPLAGLPYDGRLTEAEGENQWWQGFDPQQLYSVKHPPDALPDASFVKNFYDRTRDLVDQHDPDLLYFDNTLFPLGWAGVNAGAYFYNHNLQTHGGKNEAVTTVKNVPAKWTKAVVADIERGLAADILPHPWQSETCIGDWHYQRKLFEKPGEFGGYLPPRDVIHWLVDTVSKNGTFVLNIPGKPDGTIDAKEERILDRIGAWFQGNGEAIYGTRPWRVYGEGPDTIKAGSFAGSSVRQLGAADIRFTRNRAGTVIYAFALGWPEQAISIQSLGLASAARPGRIQHVEVLATGEKPRWRQSAAALRVEAPQRRSDPDFTLTLKIFLA